MDAADFVPAAELVPGLVEDLRYAVAENFMGQAVYDFRRAWLRRGTAEKLALAQEKLRPLGYGLKIWDAFRPLEAQYKMWEVFPHDEYVADPTHGGCSKHNRGCAVDVTLVTLTGEDVEMPTGFDDFSGAARRDAPCSSTAARAHSALLEEAMTASGFRAYVGEWWHFNDTELYPLELDFRPGGEAGKGRS